MTFKDHFSKQASDYAKYRPTYPEEFFSYLSRNCHDHSLAWDCATGNGQAALGLVPHFAKIFASDASEAQIARAFQHPKIAYSVSPAETSPLKDSSIDLVTVATGIHWFDLERFYSEVHRVLKPGGVIAAWVYYGMESPQGIDKLFEKYEREIVVDFWPPENKRWVWTRYRDLPFPFEEIKAPSLRTTFRVDSVDSAVGILQSYSATQRFIQATGRNPIELIRPEFEALLRNSGGSAELTTDINMRVGRLS